MKFITRGGALLFLFSMCLTPAAYADSATGTAIATITRFLSITNISDLEFGVVSVSSSAGSVMIDAQGNRRASGGAAINPNDEFTPARFVIQGKPNATFTVSLPRRVELKDTSGNIIAVDNIRSSLGTGRLDGEGALEITIGGQVNFAPNQSTGDYSGVLVVELNYS
jgi:hypothetical protein